MDTQTALRAMAVILFTIATGLFSWIGASMLTAREDIAALKIEMKDAQEDITDMRAKFDYYHGPTAEERHTR